MKMDNMYTVWSLKVVAHVQFMLRSKAIEHCRLRNGTTVQWDIRCLIFFTFFFVFTVDGVDADFFVILLEGGQILSGFREFSFFHTFTDIPVDESTFGVPELSLWILRMNKYCIIKFCNKMNHINPRIFLITHVGTTMKALSHKKVGIKTCTLDFLCKNEFVSNFRDEYISNMSTFQSTQKFASNSLFLKKMN